MFSATQSITPLGDFSDSFNKSEIKRPQTIEAKPECWSQNLLAGLSSSRFIQLTHSYYESLGYTLDKTTESSRHTTFIFRKSNETKQELIIACSTHEDTIDIADIKNYCLEIESLSTHESVFVTRSSFSSGALDFCANKPVTLISNREMLSIILKLDAPLQKKLLAQATT